MRISASAFCFATCAVLSGATAQEPASQAVDPGKAPVEKKLSRDHSVEILVNSFGSEYTIRKYGHAQTILEDIMEEPSPPLTRWKLFEFGGEE